MAADDLPGRLADSARAGARLAGLSAWPAVRVLAGTVIVVYAWAATEAAPFSARALVTAHRARAHPARLALARLALLRPIAAPPVTFAMLSP